jgi:uncharacterized repeat protein (TIGR01451 family)
MSFLGITAALLSFLLTPDVDATPQAMASSKAPLLEIKKVCPNLRYVGREATFEITITNRGEGAASNVTVTDVMTGGAEFLSADNGGLRDGSNIVWRLGTINAGESRVLKATVRCAQIGKISNRATASYCVEVADACEFEVKGVPAILLECVDSPDPIEINGAVTYTITVTNQGSAVGTNIMVECTLPAEEEYVSSDGPTKASASGKGVTFAPLPSLAPRANAVYRVTVKGVAVGDVRFGVQMRSDQVTSPVMETESTHIY